jgi:uncharacterized protein with HEPN domain
MNRNKVLKIIIDHREKLARDFGTFENDEEIMDAVIHNLTVIGEAANHIPAEITARHPGIPWRQMVDLRNFSIQQLSSMASPVRASRR